MKELALRLTNSMNLMSIICNEKRMIKMFSLESTICLNVFQASKCANQTFSFHWEFQVGVRERNAQRLLWIPWDISLGPKSLLGLCQSQTSN